MRDKRLSTNAEGELQQKRGQRSESPGDVRRQVLRFCRKNNVDERSAWFILAKKQFKRVLNEKADISYIKQKKNPFKAKHLEVREGILSLIPQLQPDVCGDFIKLLNFSKNLMEYTNYLTDSMLFKFIEKYINQEYELFNLEVIESVTWLVETLMEEFSAIWESTLIFPLDIVTDSYSKRIDSFSENFMT